MPGWEGVYVPDIISTRLAMQICVVFLFEQLFCYERRLPPLFLWRDSGGIRPMVDLVSVLEGYVPPIDSLGPDVFQRSWSDDWGPLASCPTSKIIGYFVACICDETL